MNTFLYRCQGITGRDYAYAQINVLKIKSYLSYHFSRSELILIQPQLSEVHPKVKASFA